jgi:hypothetical protein
VIASRIIGAGMIAFGLGLDLLTWAAEGLPHGTAEIGGCAAANLFLCGVAFWGAWIWDTAGESDNTE